MAKEIKKLRELTSEELHQQLLQSGKELIDQRFHIATGHVTDVKKVKGIKRRIARIKTIYSQRASK